MNTRRRWSTGAMISPDRDCGIYGNARRIPDTCLSADCTTGNGPGTIQHAGQNKTAAEPNRTTKGASTTIRGNSVDGVLSGICSGGRAGGDRTDGGVACRDVRDDGPACNGSACDQLAWSATCRT